MSEGYHKSARTQYPEFLGSCSFKTAADLPSTFSRSTPRSEASTNIFPEGRGVRASRLCFKASAKNASFSAATKKFTPHSAARRHRPAQLARYAWSGSRRGVRTELGQSDISVFTLAALRHITEFRTEWLNTGLSEKEGGTPLDKSDRCSTRGKPLVNGFLTRWSEVPWH